MKKLIIKIIKKQKNKTHKIFKIIAGKFLKLNSIKYFMLKVLKKKKRVKKSYFYNLHRRQIKIF
jgi:hypothetical protein